MAELRITNPFENIAQAIKESITSDDPEDHSLVTTLFNENHRAIEDAVNSLGTTRGTTLIGSWSGVTAGSTNTVPWVLPNNGGYYLLGVELVGQSMPLGTTLILKQDGVTPTVYSTPSLGNTENTGISISFGVLAGTTVTFDATWESGAGSYDLAISGLAVHVPSIS